MISSRRNTLWCPKIRECTQTLSSPNIIAQKHIGSERKIKKIQNSSVAMQTLGVFD
jgi:hypothetical protein